MNRRPSDKIAVYVGVAALVLLAGLALGRPELVAVAAPLAVLVVAGLAGARDPELAAEVTVDRERALVGDELTVELRLTAATRIERLEVLLVVPPGMDGPEGGPGGSSRPAPRTTGTARTWAMAVSLGAGEERAIAVRLTCRRWGAYWLGDVHLRAHDRFRLFTWERHLDRHAPLKVFPVPDALRALVRPLETQVSTGSHVAAQRGDGIEFADLRPFLPGDRPRSINWRATARRGALMVNQRHPERATDVVLFLDSFLDVRGPAGSTLDQAVGAAASLAAAYLRQRDRVGLVSFGGFVQWLQPGSGQAALYRLLDTLMETQVFATAAWKGIRHLPPRTLPAKALIVALTPLVDERGIAALFDLLARGYDLAVVDISPLTHAGVAAGEWGELARRLWALERETLRHRYQHLGAAVVEWTDAMHLQQVLLEVEACRRRAGLAPG
ncbi:MAG TPA: DUF58 domain-containing protein [Actinomycetota bacterium]|nr:DUF58 domain-containing protein [Actinomycetota bacterium]